MGVSKSGMHHAAVVEGHIECLQQELRTATALAEALNHAADRSGRRRRKG